MNNHTTIEKMKHLPLHGANGKPKEYIAQRFVLHEKTEQANEAQAQKDMVNEQAAGVIL